ncbi:MAG: CBS domain-containing protein [Deltaproteobacteria bacterium]|nr:CBS domain-containing protein [Deltaproteobacteria bacterium]
MRDATVTELSTLAPDEPLARAIEQTLRGVQADFPVVERGRVVGVLTQVGLVRALAKGAPVIVDDGDGFQGMVTADNLRELLLFDVGAPARVGHAT